MKIPDELIEYVNYKYNDIINNCIIEDDGGSIIVHIMGDYGIFTKVVNEDDYQYWLRSKKLNKIYGNRL